MAGQTERNVSAMVTTEELWNVTTDGDPDAYEDQLLLTGDAGEFLIRTRGAGLELVVKLTDLKMPGLSPDDQLSRFRIIKARGAEANYGVKGAQEQFPTLGSLVKYYARKPRGAVNDMMLQLSGPYTTHLVQASRPASKLLASHGEGSNEQVKSLRRHLPDSKHEQGDWGDSEMAVSNAADGPDGIYETTADIVRRAKGSIHYQSAPKAHAGDYASPLADNPSTRPKLNAPADGPAAVYVDAATVKENKKHARSLSNVMDSPPPPPPPPPPPTGMPPPPTALPAKSVAGLSGLLSGGVKLKKRAGPSLEDVEKERKAKAMERRKVPDGFKMPLWINVDADGPVKHADPGRIARLFENDPEAKCVLVDFFAYSCTNCLRTVPVLIKWAEQYHKYGLRIVGFHRPEFDFEKDTSNLARFVEDRGIAYPVGLDNESEAWKAWRVDSWPTHYLVPTPLKAGAELVKAGEPHIGDRNHDELESALVSCLIPRTGDAAAREALIKMKAEIKPANRDLFYDMEFFLGVEHREKNVVAVQNGPDCSDGVCKMPAREKKAGDGGDGGDSVGSARLDFNRNGHQGSIELHGETEDWIARPEFVSPRSDEFKMTVSFNVMAGAADTPAKVTVYMVAAEPSQAGTETTMAVTVDRGGASASAQVEIHCADRHLLGEFDNGSTITITAKRPLKVYSFYMTTEKPAVDAQEVVRRRLAANGAATNRVRHDRTSRVPVGAGKPAVFVPADKKITRRPTGQRSKPRNVNPTEADMEFLMPEGSGRSASIRIFNAYAAMHPEETLDGMFTVRESTKMAGAYIIDILGPNGKKVHVMVHSGPGPVIHVEKEDFPDLSTFVQHFRVFPLDLPGMKEKGMDTLRLGKCLANGVSMGGGVVEDAHEDNSKSAVMTSDGKVDQHGELSASPDAGPLRRKRSIVRIYHTIVVRKLKKGALPFQVKIVDGEPVVYESIDNGKNQAKNNDVILGVNGRSAKEHNVEEVLKSADKTFTMDVEREWQPSGR